MGRGSRKTYLCSQVSKRMEVACWTVLWLNRFIRQYNSLLVYSIPISLQEETDTDLPNVHTGCFVERCPLPRRWVVPTKRTSPSLWLTLTQHWKGPLRSTFPVSETLKHQSSWIILFQELIDF